MSTAELISEQTSILWRIPNFAEVLKSEALLKAQRFEFEMQVSVQKKVVPLKWKCYLCTDNDDEEDKDYIGMFITAKNLPPELSNAHVRVRFRIPGKLNRINYFEGDTAFNIKDSYGYPCALPRHPEDLDFLTADGVLETRVTVTLFYQSGVQDAELAALQAEYEDLFAANLRSNFVENEYPLNSNPPTCQIKCQDGKEFPVDRSVLAARSEVFCRMFLADMSEGRGGVVEVNDIHSTPMEALLHFIFKGELAKNWRNEGVIEGLVYGAHKYMLEDLTEFLDKVLGLVCTKENCGKLAGLAKAFGMKTAEEQLLEYFKKNLANSLEQVTSFVLDSATAAMLMTSTAEKQEDNAEEPQAKKSRLTEED